MARIVVEFLDDAGFESVGRLPEPHREIAWELLDHLRDAPRYGKPLEAESHWRRIRRRANCRSPGRCT
jgi:hypothetical protein